MRKECEMVKFCKCCGCSDEEGWPLDEDWEGYDLCVNKTGKETNHLITADELQALFNLAIAIGFKLDDYSKI